MPATDNVDCKHEAGVFQPVIDRNRCEGKDDCVRVCPYGVFDVRVLTEEEKAPLGRMSRFKLWVHGNRQAFAVNADACHGCGLCVSECPEKAIKLQRRSA
jgi:NAD-dependent dihydropyrimidine dehydrogenase PreA subunit